MGYVQGHADVVCFLIGNINDRQDDEEVFWVYASIIERCVYCCDSKHIRLYVSHCMYVCMCVCMGFTHSQSLPRGLFRAATEAPRLPSGAITSPQPILTPTSRLPY